MDLSTRQIADVLPHRYPMLLVDRIVDANPGQSLVAHKAVTVNEPWYVGLTGQAGMAYPSTLLIESWGQAAAVLGMLDSAENPAREDRVLLFGSMSNVVLGDDVFPGTLLTHRVRLFRTTGDTMIFEGASEVDGRQVLTIERMVLAVRSPESLGQQRQAE